MAFLSALDISGSALTATRLRMDVISENMAHANTTRTENGGPYRRKMVVYQPIDSQNSFRSVFEKSLASLHTGGVKVTEIVEDPTDFIPVYNPSHPDADADGYVLMPNVSSAKETMDMMAATRAYELNLTALNAIKGMAAKALEIGR